MLDDAAETPTPDLRALNLTELGLHYLRALRLVDAAEARARRLRERVRALKFHLEDRLIAEGEDREGYEAHLIEGHVFLLRDAFDTDRPGLIVMPLADR